MEWAKGHGADAKNAWMQQRWEPECAGKDDVNMWIKEKGKDFTWREALWHTVMWGRGLEGLGMVTGGVESWRKSCEECMRKIESVEEESHRLSLGNEFVEEWTYTPYPFLVRDLQLCLAGREGQVVWFRPSRTALSRSAA